MVFYVYVFNIQTTAVKIAQHLHGKLTIFKKINCDKVLEDLIIFLI